MSVINLRFFDASARAHFRGEPTAEGRKLVHMQLLDPQACSEEGLILPLDTSIGQPIQSRYTIIVRTLIGGASTLPALNALNLSKFPLLPLLFSRFS